MTILRAYSVHPVSRMNSLYIDIISANTRPKSPPAPPLDINQPSILFTSGMYGITSIIIAVSPSLLSLLHSVVLKSEVLSADSKCHTSWLFSCCLWKDSPSHPPKKAAPKKPKKTYTNNVSANQKLALFVHFKEQTPWTVSFAKDAEQFCANLERFYPFPLRRSKTV